MTALLAIALAASSLEGGAETGRLTVRVLEKFRPESAELFSSAGHHVVRVSGGRLSLDGGPAAAPLLFGQARWRLSVPGGGEREYLGAVACDVDSGRLAIVVDMGVEDYVAEVVASETLPGTPLEALSAQAVVVRSYALASRGRHGAVDLCDLAHCQVVGLRAPREHRDASRVAARRTAGEVLRLSSGRVAEAPFHAACGGQTGDPVEIFGGGSTGAASVPDAECPAAEWTAVVPARVLSRVADRLLPERAAAAPLQALDGLEFRYGSGGFVVQVGFGDDRIGGDAFARALDGSMGYGRVRSSRFRVRGQGDEVVLSGSGVGHGVGLCQTGAAIRARRGESYREILAHYFPHARLASAHTPDRRERGARAVGDRSARDGAGRLAGREGGL